MKIVSNTNADVSTPGALTNQIFLLRDTIYLLTISASKLNNFSNPFIYFGNGINAEINTRIPITSTTPAEYSTPRPIQPAADATEDDIKKYTEDMKQWSKDNSLSNLVHDGSKKRNRFHHGFIAQEIDVLNVFGGYQDLSLNGGEDVKSLGYIEFIAPLTKAVQELSKQNDELRANNASLLSRIMALESKLN